MTNKINFYYFLQPSSLVACPKSKGRRLRMKYATTEPRWKPLLVQWKQHQILLVSTTLSPRHQINIWRLVHPQILTIIIPTSKYIGCARALIMYLAGVYVNLKWRAFGYCRYTPNGYGFGPPPGGGGLSYDIAADFVDSTTSSGTGFEHHRSNSSELPDSQGMLLSPSSAPPQPPPNTSLPADSAQISELLARTITDAHNRTCLYSNGKIKKTA